MCIKITLKSAINVCLTTSAGDVVVEVVTEVVSDVDAEVVEDEVYSKAPIEVADVRGIGEE
jgi:hypothetical protein